MNLQCRYGLIFLTLVSVGGCLTPHQVTTASTLPQLVRFFTITQIKRHSGDLVISGLGSAAADSGKNTFTAKSPFSSYPSIQMTINSDDANLLSACQQQVQTARDTRQSIDIRGMGTFTIKSEIDPPVDKGIFVLTALRSCETPELSTPTATVAVSAIIPSASSDTVAAADLVAVPERYLDQPVVINGLMSSAVHFMDPVSRMAIESDGQNLAGYFVTPSLSPDSRLSLVHAAPGSLLVLRGTWTRRTSKSLAAQSGDSLSTGYEFDVSTVVSVTPAKK